MPEPTLRPMTRDDWPAVASLVHASTNAWYERHGHAPVFACRPADLELHCRVYEALDPGCCVVAEEPGSGRLLGSCFWHPRATHVSLGIMNAHPEAFGRGVARRLLQFVIAQAETRGLPLRLVSSAMNLDSFSLYSRAGFRPYAVFQDMTMAVPPGGLSAPVEGRDAVRPAREADVPAMVALERELQGIEREKDFHYFVADEEKVWRTWVLEDGGRLGGFLTSVAHPACCMLGPGAARSDREAATLIAVALHQLRGRQPVWLVPADRTELVQRMYSWGARNCELHLGQVRGTAVVPRGVVLPTFLPETG